MKRAGSTITLNKHDGVSTEISKKLAEQMGETEEKRTQYLQELKSLIKKEPDFDPCVENGYLLRYLRCRKFNVEKAFKSLKNFYAFKARYSGTITDLKPSDLRKLLEKFEYYVFEYRDFKNTCVSVIRIANYDLDEIPTDLFIAVLLLGFEIGLEEEFTQLAGSRIILDLGGLNFQKMKRLCSISLIYKLVVAFQDVVPCRIKGFHVINEPPFIGQVVKIFRMFMSDKLYKRATFHGTDLKSLHKIVPPEILPEEYGGRQGPFKMRAKEYVDKVLTFEKFVAKRNEYGFKGKALEKLRK